MKFCQKCGKEIRDEAVICPNCGCAVETKVNGATLRSPEFVPKKAKTAKILGILGLLLLPILGIPAIILANSSKVESNGQMTKAAKTGMICGIIALCLWGLGLLFMFL